MADKKSILKRLPVAGLDKDQSDIMFRFNRIAPGGLKEEGQEIFLEQDSKEHGYLQTKKTNPLIPPEGVIIPPPTAADVLKAKRKRSCTAVEYCAPVEYQNLPPGELKNGLPTDAEGDVMKADQEALKAASKLDINKKLLVLVNTEEEDGKTEGEQW